MKCKFCGRYEVKPEDEDIGLCPLCMAGYKLFVEEVAQPVEDVAQYDTLY